MWKYAICRSISRLQNSRDLSEQEQQEARMLSDALLTSWSEQLHLLDRDEHCASLYMTTCVLPLSVFVTASPMKTR